jgi:hypothetical protein
MTKLASLLKTHDAAASITKRTTRRLLMKQVRLCVEEHNEQVRRRSAAVFSPITWMPVTYDGVTYVTAMTAFQAQKACPTKRAEYANIGPGEAALKGRAEKIDVLKWDEQKEELMQDILYAQVIQTPTLKHALMKYDFRDKDPLLSDPFWKKKLPIIWMSIKQRLLEKEASDDASDDDELSETGDALVDDNDDIADDDDDDDDDEIVA